MKKITKKNIIDFSKRNSSKILFSIGISGTILSVISGISATPKAIKLIENKKRELNVDSLSKKDIIKETWKCYIPTVFYTGLSISCLIYSNNINAKKNTALLAAYHLSENALVEYKNKVIETIGENESKKIDDKLENEKINNIKNNSNIIITSNGNTLFYESTSNTLFESDMNFIKSVMNEMNYRMINDMSISLSDLYSELELDTTSISDDLGWNISEGKLEFIFNPQLTDDGRSCICINYDRQPKPDYWRC